jgi:hypothetical protein
MEITTKWQEGKYPSFNLMLASKEGAEPFITIKSCSIMQGSKGEFVKYPSKKMDDGKWFNYIYANEKFNVVVLEKAKASQPRQLSEPTRKPVVEDLDDGSGLPF